MADHLIAAVALNRVNGAVVINAFDDTDVAAAVERDHVASVRRGFAVFPLPL